jgi:hypothetical protein
MKLYVTKRAEPDRRLQFKRQRPLWEPALVFVLGVLTGVGLFWALFYDGP